MNDDQIQGCFQILNLWLGAIAIFLGGLLLMVIRVTRKYSDSARKPGERGRGQAKKESGK